MDLAERLGVEHPVVQAALGGGLSMAELAAAVSRAGGLGTVGIVPSPAAWREELRRAREHAAGHPFAANLLLPVARREHVRACIEEHVPVVSLFYGFDRRVVQALHEAGATVLHQVGTVSQAERALADGADGLIVQGEGAGGHVLGSEPLERLIPAVVEVAGDRPVVAAGGIFDAASAGRARAMGAHGVAVGTRFLLTPESRAHPAYKARLLAAGDTLLTLLFGLGWHGPHRVVGNAATARWCRRHVRGPVLTRAVDRVSGPLTKLLPPKAATSLVDLQRLSIPLYSPLPPLEGMDEAVVDVTPLYAGACVRHIDALMRADRVVDSLARGFR